MCGPKNIKIKYYLQNKSKIFCFLLTNILHIQKEMGKFKTLETELLSIEAVHQDIMSHTKRKRRQRS